MDQQARTTGRRLRGTAASAGMRSARLRGLALAAAVLAAGPAAAHEFTAAILSVGEGREARLAEAVRGFLLAADERDGHGGQTSDGHIGGVDVNILPLPAEAAGGVGQLNGRPDATPHVVVVVGPEKEASAAMAEASANSAVLRPGTLPARAVWTDAAAADSFAERYRSAYGTAPTEAAAEGYNAARRLELAIRPLDGTEPRAELASALATTEAGIDW